jgi:hypothetical protein
MCRSNIFVIFSRATDNMLEIKSARRRKGNGRYSVKAYLRLSAPFETII